MQELDSDDFVANKLAMPDDETPSGLYPGLVGAASVTCKVASGAWKWLQVLAQLVHAMLIELSYVTLKKCMAYNFCHHQPL